MSPIITLVKRVNNGVAIIAGIALLVGVGLTSLEIVLRALGIHFSGSEELSGYLMAAITSWGISYALVHRAHVRIDLLRARAGQRVKCLFDLAAMASVSFVAIYAALKVTTVVEKSIRSQSLSNTALEVPLVIPQTIWMLGWCWFALSSTVLLLVGVYYFLTQRFEQVDKVIGTESEV
ncbi:MULTISPECIES: TRAP transporter small permease subunit [unclassified Vibrio]|uniref:TRAP transporter small permease protein n=1 Tax=Vibrio sp. HB236076 TaxID=3232307 RepID=A0AB39HJI1_9VIBR|nr:TRAP transporter small permease [Vibrio sp. HB161653]MDP5252733.1 TRAP transporter small permease [Vibrio sp. HB161653]